MSGRVSEKVSERANAEGSEGVSVQAQAQAMARATAPVIETESDTA